MSRDDADIRAAPGSRIALAVLVALVVVSPWPFGSVDPRATQGIALVSLATALGAHAWDARRGQLRLPAFVLWPLLGLWLLAALQLAPWPAALHHLIAPGSAAVWQPDVPEAAAVLGPGPHPISLDPEATRRWLSFTTGLLALALAAAPALRERRLLLRAAIAIVAGAVAVAVYGLVARLAFPDKLYGIWSVPTVAPFGPFVNKNHFAGYVELAALLAVGLAAGLSEEARRDASSLSWIESRRARWIVAAWGAAFVLVLAVLVSLSRGGVVSLSAGLVVFLVLRLWARGSSRLSPRGFAATIALLLLAAAVVASLLPVEARARVLSLTGVTSEASGSYRIAVWRDTARLVASSPLAGSGFGAYAYALPRFKTAAGQLAIEHAENDVLEAVAEGGFLGAALFLCLAGFVLVYGLRAVLSEARRLPRALATGALAGGLALAVHSAFDFNLRLPSNALAFTALVAVLLAFAANGVPARPTRVLAAAVVAASLAVGPTTPWAAARLDSGPLQRAAPSAATSLRRAALEKDLVAHLRGHPTDPAAWLALAWLRVPASRSDAAALGGWAVRLDPTSQGVRDAASLLSSGPRR